MSSASLSNRIAAGDMTVLDEIEKSEREYMEIALSSGNISMCQAIYDKREHGMNFIHSVPAAASLSVDVAKWLWDVMGHHHDDAVLNNVACHDRDWVLERQPDYDPTSARIGTPVPVDWIMEYLETHPDKARIALELILESDPSVESLTSFVERFDVWLPPKDKYIEYIKIYLSRYPDRIDETHQAAFISIEVKVKHWLDSFHAMSTDMTKISARIGYIKDCEATASISMLAMVHAVSNSLERVKYLMTNYEINLRASNDVLFLRAKGEIAEYLTQFCDAYIYDKFTGANFVIVQCEPEDSHGAWIKVGPNLFCNQLQGAGNITKQIAAYYSVRRSKSAAN